MPKISDRIKVQVKDTSTDKEGIFQIRVEYEKRALSLSRVLQKEGVIRPVEKILRDNVKSCISDYIQRGREIVRRAASQADPAKNAPSRSSRIKVIGGKSSISKEESRLVSSEK